MGRKIQYYLMEPKFGSFQMVQSARFCQMEHESITKSNVKFKIHRSKLRIKEGILFENDGS